MGIWSRAGNVVDRFASGVSLFTSQPLTFIAAFVVVMAWTAATLVVGIAESWVSVMHMTGPLVTLLLVLLLQHGQAKNTRAVQLKLDELVRSKSNASDDMVKAEKRPSRELNRLEKRSRVQAHRSRRGTRRPTEPLTKKA